MPMDSLAIDTARPAAAPKVTCDSVLPLAALKKGLKRWEDFYKKKYNGFCLDSFRFGGCAENKYMMTMETNVSQEDLELYKSLFIFSPDHKKYLDLDSYNYLLSRNKQGRIVAETGDPEEEIAVVDIVLQQRVRLAYYTSSDLITEDACWVDTNKVALVMLAPDDQGAFGTSLSIIDLSTHAEADFTSNLKMKAAVAGEYMDKVRRKGIGMK